VHPHAAHFIGGVRSVVDGTPAFFIHGARYDDPSGLFALGEAIDRLLPATTR